MSETTGNRIKWLRESKKWTQEELAQKIDISRVSLSAIENNRRQIEANELSLFADSLDVSADQLLGRVPFQNVRLEKTVGKQKANAGMRINVPARNVEKFREVLLYVLSKVGAKPNVGETVLYKLIYFIDFDFYEKYEEQIIGATYKKNTYGPTPIEFLAIVNDMIEKGELEKIKSKYFSKEQKKYLPRREARLDLLNAKELKLINEVINRLGDKNDNQLSEYSHGDVPLQVTENQGIIDYETVFYRTAQYSMRNDQDEL
jgi:transcriptional regulator with XRE-family HTH domain